MSMIGNYLRIQEDTVHRLIKDPSQIIDVLYPPDGREHPAGSHLSIDKSWHAIHFLLNGHPWKGDAPLCHVVMGGIELGTEDVGYGPARYLLPNLVTEVSAALSALPGETLWKRFDAKAFAQENIYPHGWDEGGKPYILGNYEMLRKFFAETVAQNTALEVISRPPSRERGSRSLSKPR
jgi:hypothetical protein